MSENSREPGGVVFVTHVGTTGGAELTLLDLSRRIPDSRVILFEAGPLRERLAEQGTDASVLALPESVASVRREAGLGAAARAAGGLMGQARRLASATRGASLVYANSQKAFVVAALARLFSGRPLIWHLRDMLIAEHFSRANIRLVVTLANRLADRVIANSEATRRAFIEAGGSATRSVAIHNGIDAEPLRAAARQAEPRPRGSRFRVGCFGRLTPWKGQDVLLDALASLPEEVEAWIVGDAMFGEDEYRERVHEQARLLGLSERVCFLGFRRDVPGLIQQCDVIAHTARSPEPFGRVIVEAMMSGKPVIATAAGGALEILEHGRSGLLVPPGDSTALAGAIDRLRSDPELASRLATDGEREAMERFALDVSIRRIREVVELVARR